MFDFTCTVEDVRKIRGGAPRKIQVEELMVRKVYDSPYGVAGQTESLLLPAPRKIWRGCAEDPLRIPAGDMTGGTHAMENSPVQLVEFCGIGSLANAT